MNVPATERQNINNTRRASGDLDPDKGITILVIILFSGRTYKHNNIGINSCNFFHIDGTQVSRQNLCRIGTALLSLPHQPPKKICQSEPSTGPVSLHYSFWQPGFVKKQPLTPSFPPVFRRRETGRYGTVTTADFSHQWVPGGPGRPNAAGTRLWPFPGSTVGENA